MAEQLVGSVTHYFAQPGVGVVAITDGAVQVGDTIHVVGAHSDFTMKIGSLEIDHDAVESAGVGDSVGIKMTERAREHDRVFVVT
jgi:translation elongation factor EF-Tu-like GTPase